jgi:hypothetical protein
MVTESVPGELHIAEEGTIAARKPGLAAAAAIRPSSRAL